MGENRPNLPTIADLRAPQPGFSGSEAGNVADRDESATLKSAAPPASRMPYKPLVASSRGKTPVLEQTPVLRHARPLYGHCGREAVAPPMERSIGSQESIPPSTPKRKRELVPGESSGEAVRELNPLAGPEGRPRLKGGQAWQ